MPEKRSHDVCVIGTGAAGGVWIDACTRAGLDVVALERGPLLEPVDFARHDEWTNTHRRVGFAPDYRDTLREDESQIARPGVSASLAQCVGGGTAHWGAVCWRMREDEFRVRSIEGPIEGTSVADWPIGYADLAPFYDRVERRLGVAGTAGSNPFEPQRRQSYPNPPHPPRRATLALNRGAEQLGQHPFPTPLAVNPRPWDGRGLCLNGGQCATFGCPTQAKASTLAIHIPAALATGRLDLRTRTRVVELRLGEDGRVRAALTVDGEGRESEVRASTFVLAAGTLGSAHLLLSSRSARFPHGLANGSGLVGRNLMFHILSYIGFELAEPTMGAFGPVGMMSIDDLHPSDSSRGFVRGAVVSESPEPGPLWAAYKAPEYLGRTRGAWGKPLKDFLRRYPQLGALISIGEDLPQHENRVDLDPDHVDALGLPLPRITHRSHPNDLALARWYAERMKEIARAAGAVRVYEFDYTRAKGGSGHMMGSCRMGKDPARSVVDADCRSHEVANLYVPDGSCFPTSSGYNPTLTIFAVAERAVSRFLARRQRREEA